MSRELEIRNELLAQLKTTKSLLSGNKADKFMATAKKIADDYKLRECHPKSIVDACVSVAELGLDLSPALSQVYLVPFKQRKDAKVANVQLIISARGYTALLSRNGWSVKSFIVNEGDTFHYKMDGFEESVVFEKNLDDADEKFKYAVALAKSPNGELFVEVMNKAQIEKHRKVSSNQNGDNPTGVWAEWYNEMAKKTVIKKLVKSLPLGEDIAQATFIDDKPIEAEIEDISKPTLNEIKHNPSTGEVDEDIEV